MASYRYLAADTEARAMRNAILERAAAAQALLETAVPRPIARALLAGVPALELTRSVPSASVAFIALSEAPVADAADDPTVRHYLCSNVPGPMGHITTTDAGSPALA